MIIKWSSILKPTIIIFGYSKTSKEILEILEFRCYNYLLIESEWSAIELAKSDNILSYNITLTQDENLKKVGIGNGIEALFCLHKDKNLNLFVTFSARNIDKSLKIITIIDDMQDRQKMILAGADRVVSPNNIGGYRISRMIKKPNLLDILDSILFKKTKILRAEITVSKDSFLDGVCLNSISIERDYDLIIIGLQDMEIGRDFIFYFEEENHKMNEGDVIVVLGYEENIERLKSDLKERV